jgi:hypothetical protein
MGLSIYRVPRRLYWTADRSRLVEHGDVEAAFLAYPAGESISLLEAERNGLLALVDAPVTPAAVGPVAVEKHREITRNKMRGRPEDKTAVVQQTVTETTVVKEKP